MYSSLAAVVFGKATQQHGVLLSTSLYPVHHSELLTRHGNNLDLLRGAKVLEHVRCREQPDNVATLLEKRIPEILLPHCTVKERRQGLPRINGFVWFIPKRLCQKNTELWPVGMDLTDEGFAVWRILTYIMSQQQADIFLKKLVEHYPPKAANKRPREEVAIEELT